MYNVYGNGTGPECIEDHGEEYKLPEEGDHEGGRGDDLRQQQEEHSQGQQDGDRQRHLYIHMLLFLTQDR